MLKYRRKFSAAELHIGKHVAKPLVVYRIILWKILSI
jgi:hypothetical protein